MTQPKTYLRLRSFMTLHCLTQKDLGEWLGITSNAINFKMNRERITHQEEKIILKHLKDFEPTIDRSIFFD